MYEHVEERRHRIHEDTNECSHFETSHIRGCHAVFDVCVVAGVGQAGASPSRVIVKVALEGSDKFLAGLIPLWSHNTRNNVHEEEVYVTVIIPALRFSV